MYINQGWPRAERRASGGSARLEHVPLEAFEPSRIVARLESRARDVARLARGLLELVQDSKSFRCSKLFFTVVAYILILAQPAINDLCATYKSLLNPKHTESS